MSGIICSNVMASCLPETLVVFLLFLSSSLLHQNSAASGNEKDEFIFNGFGGANLTLDDSASITSSGLLMLTNNTRHTEGHALYPTPLRFRRLPGDGAVVSFSTTFVFAIIPLDASKVCGHGMTFFVSPTTDFSRALGSQFLGLFNSSNNGNSTNHVFAVELDSVLNTEYPDIDDNHVGVDINGITSIKSHTAGYFGDDKGEFNNLSLISGEPMQIWVDYDGERTQLNVTLAPIPMAKPRRPLMSADIDLSSVLSDPMYVGFSMSTGSFLPSIYVLGWSFKMDGTARPLDYNLLPSLSLPRTKSKPGRKYFVFIGIPVASAGLVLLIAIVIGFIVRRRRWYAEVLEEWEREFGPHRFSYRDLFEATKGFADEELMGKGGFGGVYKGVLPSSKVEVAVKRVSHESRQGMREFIAEIVSLGHLRHRNLVPLLGYCRRKRELILVYEYMPRGSLDKVLFDHSRPALDWAARLRIIRGVAAGLLYLHEEWEQLVVHRDIKASNVLLDEELNGRLGDFGLARLYDHGSDPLTTHVVGTMGYLAPELARTGKATTSTDVFAFGTFVLEVACGRRPVSLTADGEPLVLVDWVVENWRKGSMLAARDPRLGEEYAAEEVELVMKLGLLCTHPLPSYRPGMRRVVQYLDGDALLQDLLATTPVIRFRSGSAVVDSGGFDDSKIAYSSTSSSVAADSDISGGR